MGCLHAYSAASNGDYYGAEKAVDCAAQLIVQCAEDEFEALFPKFQPSRVTITTCSNARSLSPHFSLTDKARSRLKYQHLPFAVSIVIASASTTVPVIWPSSKLAAKIALPSATLSIV